MSDCVAVGAAQLHVRRCDEGEGRPVLLIHGAGGSARLIEGFGQSLLGNRPMLALDWLGHGASSAWPAGDGSDLLELVQSFRIALQQLGVDELDVFAVECGGGIAFKLAALDPQRIGLIAWNEVLFPDDDELGAYREHYAPAIEPDHHGGYLLSAWGFVRDQGLYSPWFDKSGEAIIWDLADFDLERAHQQVLALLQALPAIRRAYDVGFDSAWRAVLADASVAVRVCTSPRDPRSRQVENAARLLHQPPTLLAQPDTQWVQQALS